MSVVIRCRMADARAAVLKISPDRIRLANEAAALERWTTVHTPSVLAIDGSVGALLLEAIEPGTPLLDSPTYPRLESVAELLTAGGPDGRGYVASERFTGTIDGRHGTVVFQHSGLDDGDRPRTFGRARPVLSDARPPGRTSL